MCPFDTGTELCSKVTILPISLFGQVIISPTSLPGPVRGILAVSRAFGDYEFKGGRFDLLEDLKTEVNPL